MVSLRRWVAAPLLALAIAGCGASPVAAPSPAAPASARQATPAAPAPAPAPVGGSKTLTPVSLRLDWILGDYETPTVVAKADGYYAQAGLATTIGEGKGSGSTIELVANGKATFGLADAATTALFISKGAPVKVLAVFIQQTPDSFMTHDAIGPVSDPKMLAGRQIIDTAGSADSHLLAAVLKRSEMTMSQVTMDYVAPSDKYAVFLKSPQSVLLDYYPDDYVQLKERDPRLTDTSYAKFGVNPLSVGLITSLAEIRQHPNIVRAFVGATLKGYAAAAADPAGAVAIGRKAFPDSVDSVEAMKDVLGMFHTPATQGKPIGWMAASDWQETVNLMHEYGGLQDVQPIDTYYTNQFIPS